MGDELKFDCADCVAFCCSGVYQVSVEGAEVARLCLRLGLTPQQFFRRYTKADGVTLRHKPDPLFGEVCVFLDTLERRCTVYSSRPDACRAWPRPEHAAPGAEGRCCFYDLYTHVRNEQEPEAMPLVQIVRLMNPTHPAARPKPKEAAG